MEFFNELLHLLERNPTMHQAQSFDFKCAKSVAAGAKKFGGGRKQTESTGDLVQAP